MKSKGLILLGIFLGFTIIADVITFWPRSLESSNSEVDNYIDNTFNSTFFTLTDDNFLNKLIASDLNIPQLRELKTISDDLSNNGTTCTVRKDQRTLFWVIDSASEDTCRVQDYKGFEIMVCLDIIERDSFLTGSVIDNLNLGSEFIVEIHKDEFERKHISLKPVSRHRSILLNALFLSIYLAIFTCLAFYFIHIYLPGFFILMGIRGLLYLFDWSKRFANIDAAHPDYGFSLVNPTQVDYFMNGILVLALAFVSQKVLTKESKIKVPEFLLPLFIVSLHFFFILHIVEIRSLVFNSSLYFNFEDLTQLGVLDYFAMSNTIIFGIALII
ncbi:MAG: hypothetical protein MJD61_18220, partial [Proteobacteria bacterium]|nr:hypothetical protein [Pseudomonadota bacterium]